MKVQLFHVHCPPKTPVSVSSTSSSVRLLRSHLMAAACDSYMYSQDVSRSYAECSLFLCRGAICPAATLC